MYFFSFFEIQTILLYHEYLLGATSLSILFLLLELLMLIFKIQLIFNTDNYIFAFVLLHKRIVAMTLVLGFI